MRRCGWCDRTDVSFGYDHLPPACVEHRSERLRTLSEIEGLHLDSTRQWSKVRASESMSLAIFNAGQEFAYSDDDDIDWTQPVAGWVLFAPVE